jgi:hypothetical protein
MRHFVIDTNVLLAAGGLATHISVGCRAKCGNRLREATASWHIYIDEGYEILGEYQRYFSALKGEPTPASLFLKWLMTHQYHPERVTRVPIQRKATDKYDFDGLPDGNQFDRNDRKFLAVAVGHGNSPSVLQATDSKWVGWKESLAEIGVHVEFVCDAELRATHVKKSRK